jgi:hypothetical protein
MDTGVWRQDGQADAAVSRQAVESTAVVTLHRTGATLRAGPPNSTARAIGIWPSSESVALRQAQHGLTRDVGAGCTMPHRRAVTREWLG